MTTLARSLGAALAAALLPALALAQAPPIKPGLWEVHAEREVNGQPAATAADSMKKMSPEVRARMEAMMKQRGMATGSGGASHVCLSKESLDPAYWQHLTNCKTDFVGRTATAWKWHTVCPQNDAVIDGEAVFASAESYTIKTASTRTFRGESKVTKMAMQAKWLGADCGELKPVDLKR
jgi:hypothetical protein